MPVDHCPVSWRVRVQAQAYLSPSYVLQHGDAVLVSVAAYLLAHSTLYPSFHDDRRCACACLYLSVSVHGQMEAYQNLTQKHKHSSHFALLREVPDSQPPRTNQLMDRVRMVWSGVGECPADA
jgi:hypothetical protein